jgi:hypothetical protein
MRETSHDDLRYSGQEGETVTVTVDAQNTVQMVEYTLDGNTQSLPAGQSIQFQLHSGTNVLQMVFDSAPAGGTYRVVVRTVENEPNSECVHVFTHRGSILIEEFRFFV